MKLSFEVDGAKADFFRSWLTGRCTLTVNGATTQLQSPLDATTHFSVTLQREWQAQVNGHQVRIEKQRPILFAGVRPQSYRIFVDDNLVVARTGF